MPDVDIDGKRAGGFLLHAQHLRVPPWLVRDLLRSVAFDGGSPDTNNSVAQSAG